MDDEIRLMTGGRLVDPSRSLSSLSAFMDDADDPAEAGTAAGTGGGGVGGIRPGCGEATQTACAELLNVTFTDAAHMADEQHVVPFIDDHRLDTICRHLRAARKCLYGTDEVAIPICEPYDSIRHGQELALDFMCADGYAVYRAERSCLSSASVTTDCNQCYAEFERRLTLIAEARKRRRSRVYKQHSVCLMLSLETLVRCFTDVTNASCGEKAAKWVFAYKSRLITPVKWKIVAPHSNVSTSSVECDEPSVSRESPFIFYVVFGLLLAVALLTLTLYITGHRRQRSDAVDAAAATAGREHVFAGIRLVVVSAATRGQRSSPVSRLRRSTPTTSPTGRTGVVVETPEPDMTGNETS